jgi:hypothetical protein
LTPPARAWTGPALSLAAILVTTVALGAAELLLRLARPAFLRDAPAAQAHVYSEVYGWSLRPDYRGRWENGETFSVNHAAYRGRELHGPPRAGVTRIVMLGDSIAFGTGVGDEETFAQLLQEARPELEVANLAVSGYGTDQALLRLEHEGFALRPGVVVLHFCLANDFVDNMLDSYLYDGRTPKPYFVIAGGELSLRAAHLRRGWIEGAALRVRESSYLFDAFSRLGHPEARTDGLLAEAAEGHWIARKNRVLAELDDAVLLTLRLVRRMADLCRERGAGFLLVLHPDRPSFPGESKLTAPFAEGRPELAGVRVVDLRRVYASAGLDFDAVATDKIGHLSPRGHALVAEALGGELARMPHVRPR